MPRGSSACVSPGPMASMTGSTRRPSDRCVALRVRGTDMQAIETKQQHRAALKRIDRLMRAKSGPRLRELKVLAILVQHYERTAFPIKPPTPLEAIRFRMEQMGYSQADLGRVLGSRSRASEILKGATRLSIGMVRR